MKNKLFSFSLLIIVLAISACQPKVTGPQIIVEDAWGQPSPMVAASGVFYMVINNKGNQADTLLSAKSDACGVVELHESYMKDDGSMGMKMVEGGRIDVPAGGSVELKVGGLHMMCINKIAEFKTGDKYALVLTFEKSGEIVVEVEIKEP